VISENAHTATCVRKDREAALKAAVESAQAEIESLAERLISAEEDEARWMCEDGKFVSIAEASSFQRKTAREMTNALMKSLDRLLNARVGLRS
jgi:hypothetical protein